MVKVVKSGKKLTQLELYRTRHAKHNSNQVWLRFMISRRDKDWVERKVNVMHLTQCPTVNKHHYRSAQVWHALSGISQFYLMVVPRHRLSTVGRRAFAVHGPMVWNSLPYDFRAQQDYESFRQGVKTWLVSRY